MALSKQLLRGHLPHEIEVRLSAAESSRRILRPIGASAMTECSSRIWFRFLGQEISPILFNLAIIRPQILDDVSLKADIEENSSQTCVDEHFQIYEETVSFHAHHID